MTAPNQVSIAVKTDTSATQAALNGLNKQFKDAGTAAGASGVQAIQAQFQRLQLSKLGIAVDTATVTSQLAVLQAQAAKLKIKIAANLDDAGLKAELDQLNLQIKQLQSQKLEVRVDATQAAQSMAELRQQAAGVGAVLPPTESTLSRLGEAANKAGTQIYFMSFGLTALAPVSPVFETLGMGVANMSGIVSLAGPVMEMFGKKTQGAGTAARGAAAQVVAADGEMIAANEAVAASSEATSMSLGPIGVIAGVAALGLGLLTANMAQNQKQNDAEVTSLQNLSQAFEQSKGAIDDNVNAQLAQQLVSAKGDTAAQIQNANTLGISLQTLTSAMQGNGQAAGQIQSKVNAASLAYLTATGTSKGATKAQGDAAEAANELGMWMKKEGIEFKSASDEGKLYAQILAALQGTTSATAGVTEDLAGALNDAKTAASGLYATIAQDVGGMIQHSNAAIGATLDQDQFNDSLANFNDTLNGTGGGGRGSTKKAVAAVVDVLGDYNDELDKLSNNNIAATEAQDKFNSSMLTLKTDLASATALKLQTGAVLLNTQGAINNRDAVLDQVKAINDIAAAQLKSGASASTVTKNMKDNEAQLLKSATAAGLAKREVQQLIAEYATNPSGLTPAVKAKEASDAAAAAAKAAADAEASYANAAANTTIKLNAGRDAVLARLQDINGIAQAELNAGVPIDQVTSHLKNNEAALLKTGTQAGLTKKEVQGLITQYGLVPKEISTKVTADTDLASQKLAVMVALEDAAQGRKLSSGEIMNANWAEANLKTGYAHGGIWSAATGGTRGGWGTMNERGGEAVRLPNGSTVMSAEDTNARYGSGGGSPPMSLEIHSGGSALDDFLVELLRKAIRVRGGNVQTALGY